MTVNLMHVLLVDNDTPEYVVREIKSKIKTLSNSGLSNFYLFIEEEDSARYPDISYYLQCRGITKCVVILPPDFFEY